MRDFDYAAGTRYFVTGAVDLFWVHDHEQDPNPEQGRRDCSHRVPRSGRTYRSIKAARNAAARLEVAARSRQKEEGVR